MLVEFPETRTVVHESSPTHIPLFLEIAGTSLQHSAYAWHTQARIHLLLLQLKRFRRASVHSAVRDWATVLVQAGEIVRIHCF